MPSLSYSALPCSARTLAELRASGWQSKTVKQEIHDNFLRMLAAGDELFPGIVGYEDTVIPEINLRASSPGTTCCSSARRGRPRAG